MSLEAIKQIGEIERQAEEIVAKAKLDAREKASDAQKSVSELRSRLIAEENGRVQQLVADAQARGETDAAASVDKAYAECEATALSALKNMPSAISLIVGRVVKS